MTKNLTNVVRTKLKFDTIFPDGKGRPIRPTLITITDGSTGGIIGFSMIRPEGKVTHLTTYYVHDE